MLDKLRNFSNYLSKDAQIHSIAKLKCKGTTNQGTSLSSWSI